MWWQIDCDGNALSFKEFGAKMISEIDLMQKFQSSKINKFTSLKMHSTQHSILIFQQINKKENANQMWIIY